MLPTMEEGKVTRELQKLFMASKNFRHKKRRFNYCGLGQPPKRLVILPFTTYVIIAKRLGKDALLRNELRIFFKNPTEDVLNINKRVLSKNGSDAGHCLDQNLC